MHHQSFAFAFLREAFDSDNRLAEARKYLKILRDLALPMESDSNWIAFTDLWKSLNPEQREELQPDIDRLKIGVRLKVIQLTVN
jgi:hypothetical protein